MSRRAVFWIAASVTTILGLVTAGALVAMFIFGYDAALSPGPDPERAKAAGMSFLLALVAGVLTFGGFLVTVLADEVR